MENISIFKAKEKIHYKKIKYFFDRVYKPSLKDLKKKTLSSQQTFGFIKWHYFNKKISKKFFCLNFKKTFVSSSGINNKFLINKKTCYQLVGLATHQKFQKKGLFTYLINFVLKKFNDKFIFVINNKKAISTLRKLNFFDESKELNSYKINLNSRNIKKINYFISKRNLLFDNKIFYKERYINHPYNNYLIKKTKESIIILKKYDNSFDLIDIIFLNAKKINMCSIFNYILEKAKKENIHFLNLIVFKNNDFCKLLTRLSYKPIINNYKFFTYKSLKKNNKVNFNKKIIFLGDCYY